MLSVKIDSVSSIRSSDIDGTEMTRWCDSKIEWTYMNGNPKADSKRPPDAPSQHPVIGPE